MWLHLPPSAFAPELADSTLDFDSLCQALALVEFKCRCRGARHWPKYLRLKAVDEENGNV